MKIALARLFALGFLASTLVGAAFAEGRTALRPYLGSLHDHTAEGGDDGAGTVAEALARARAAGFDFFALTPHNHMIDDATYASLRAQTAAATEPGAFVALAGFEWGTISKGGHAGVIGAERLCHAKGGEWERFWSEVDRDPGDPLVVLNHAVWNRGFGGAPTPSRDRRAALIEVLGGPGHPAEDADGHEEPDVFFEDALTLLGQGWRGGVAYGEDDHSGRFGSISQARMGVWAEALTPEALMAALRAGRTFATLDHRLSVWMEAGVPMGGEAPLGPTVVRALAACLGGGVDEMVLLYDADGPGGERAAEVRRISGARLELPLRPDSPGAFALVMARSRSGAVAWSSPVFFGAAEAYLPPPSRQGRAEGPADLNFASKAGLKRVDGIGKGTANRIARARNEGAVFLRVRDLEAVEGFDPERVRKLAPGLYVGPLPETTHRLQRTLEAGQAFYLEPGTRRHLAWVRARGVRVFAAQAAVLLGAGKAGRVCGELRRLERAGEAGAGLGAEIRAALAPAVRGQLGAGGCAAP